MKLKRKSKARTPAAKRHVATEPLLIRRVLVPIDFSEHSKNALQYAVSFARQFSSELVLVYVVEPAIYPADFSFGQVALPNIENELRERGKEELEQLVKAHIGTSLPARTMIRTGKPYLEIVTAAAEENADLIIIATHGHSGMEHLLFGGTAERVVRKAPCPVLMVRPAGPETPEA